MLHVLLAVIFINENLVNAVIRIIGPQEKPVKYVYEQGCYLKSLDQIISFNSTHSPTNYTLECVQYFCDYDEFIYVTECINSFEGECTLVKGNASLPYPYCCDYCDPLNKKSTNVSPTSETKLATATPNDNQTNSNSIINISYRAPKPENKPPKSESENKPTESQKAKTIRKNLDEVDENVKNKESVNNKIVKPTTSDVHTETNITSVDKTKTANKLDTGLENIPEAKLNKKSKNNLESESEKKSNAQPGNKTEAETSSKPNILSDTEDENKSPTKSDNKLEDASERKQDTHPETENQTEVATERTLKNESGNETKQETESERKSTEIKSGTTTESNPKN